VKGTKTKGVEEKGKMEKERKGGKVIKVKERQRKRER